ncbi:hypothetical protein A3E39_00060 [Candidatus Uhrbacteria bacterium RIFCSPHIGHO2_12_FULL_60_25]|uniref:Lipoprotein n=1 Tax=Candidatus Uhrbacteria bacterium RIFCSPHIGHO2_12_FULL_60_25 TaxID=1802399 RepID=A0A1F7UMJ3_9BACT|nr:MAG: hypothetical protein A3D73_02725 [Candidatus Uhrbacteria bacterium RIFCSPHIGHO2_02_FULL_60_44]OGL79500.1 MAG: hypothetical protein A3E39_00060 [Candidatus Uhrbacteria bacterium RIFCSPHIGHO2_12_FULL_60_25]
MKRPFAFVTTLGLLATLGFGCNPFQAAKDKISEKIGEKVVEKTLEKAIEKSGAKDVDVDLDKQGFTFKDEKTGQVFSMGDNVAVPDNFPSDVPRYPDATPKSVTMNEEQQEASLMLETSGGLDEVVAWYKDEMPKQGWKSASSFDSAQAKIMSFEKDENGGTAKLSVSVTGDTSDGKTSIILARNGVEKE